MAGQRQDDDTEVVESAQEVERKPTEPVEEKKPVRYTHTPRLLALARSLDIPDAESQLYTPQELIGVINAIQAQQANTRAAAPPPPQPEPEPEIDWGIDQDTGKPLTERDLHPALAASIKRQHARDIEDRKWRREQEEWRKKVEQQEEERAKREEQRQLAQMRADMDRLFQRDAEYFGSEAYEDLDPNGVHYKRRRRAALMMEDYQGSLPQRYEAVREELGLKVAKKAKPAPEPEEDEDIEPDEKPARRPRSDFEPREVTHGLTRAEQRALDADRKRWDANGGLSNPSHRKSPDIDEPGTKKAAKEVRKMLKERGIAIHHDSAGDEEDLLPE